MHNPPLSNTPSKENLKREIGISGLTSAVVNVTIGAGIFVLPALVAENLGAAALLCYLICGTLIFFIGLCFAEVGSIVTVSGGTYAYIESAFGPFAGFLANNIFWFGSCVLSDAAIANALSKTLSYFFPMLETESVRFIFFIFLFGGLALINIRGARQGVTMILFTTIAKLIPLILIIAFGSGHISMENLQWKFAPSLNDIGASSLLLFYAFLGIETAVTNSGEFRNPSRTVPLGILFGLAIVLLVYISIQAVTQGILGDQLTTFKDAPLTEVAKLVFGKAGITMIVAGTAISIFGALSGEILAIPRVLYAGSRDGIFPKFLSKVHPKYFTPHVAIAIYSCLGFLFAVFGVFKQLAVLSSAATLLVYLGVVLSVIKMRQNKLIRPEKSFRIFGGYTVPVIATMGIIWLLSNLSKSEIAGIAIFILILSVAFLFVKLLKNKNSISTNSK